MSIFISYKVHKTDVMSENLKVTCNEEKDQNQVNFGLVFRTS